MALKLQALLLVFTLSVVGFGSKNQLSLNRDWREVEPQSVTLFSRIKHQAKFKGYGKAAFSFKHNVRSDPERETIGNNYNLLYGNISIDGDSDWFYVLGGRENCSRVKDLGEWNWSDVHQIPRLPAWPYPQEGIRMPSKNETNKTIEESSNGRVTKVIAGHIYVLHSKDSEVDFYTLLRVDKLAPSDECTISWKVVPSPEE